jgi:NADH:ubiquinone oxidoreductase subunit K
MHLLNLYNCLTTYLVIAALLFALGVYGMVSRRTIIGMLISAELMLAGASTNFLAFNRFLAPDPAIGQIFALFIMAIAAAEAAIAVSIMIAVYRNYKTIDTNDLSQPSGISKGRNYGRRIRRCTCGRTWWAAAGSVPNPLLGSLVVMTLKKHPNLREAVSSCSSVLLLLTVLSFIPSLKAGETLVYQIFRCCPDCPSPCGLTVFP